MRMPLIEDDLDIVSFIRFGFKEAALLSTWPSEVAKTLNSELISIV